ncbi:MAG: hypothetical protein R3235_09935 [Altererythrobacter ishigakiensis]|nr:hypothetical protein [Altererythrobacter ishigakiensis]
MTKLSEYGPHHDDQGHDMTPVHERRADTPTDREAVERIASIHTSIASVHVSAGGGYPHSLYLHQETAKTLRALLARAEAAEAERDALLDEASAAKRMYLSACTKANESRKERDTLKAEVERLREAHSNCLLRLSAYGEEMTPEHFGARQETDHD